MFHTTINAAMRRVLPPDDDREPSAKTREAAAEIAGKTRLLNDCVIYDGEGIAESDASSSQPRPSISEKFSGIGAVSGRLFFLSGYRFCGALRVCCFIF